MKNLKSNNGITLVTLAVTIIVMLILAGIVIGTLTGDEGFITKSKGIRKNIEQSELEGQQRINTLKDEQAYDDKLGTVILNDENAPTINSMEVTKLTQNSMKVSVNITETGSGLAKIEYSIDDGQHYITPENNQAKTYVFEDLKLGFEEYKIKVKVTDVSNNSSYASKTIEKFKIGDYVNYTYDDAEDYLLEQETSGHSTTQYISQRRLGWRILNINDDGSLDLISDLIRVQVYFSGAKGYNNGVYLINDICAKQYSNKSLGVTARSLTIEDIEKGMNAKGMAAREAYIGSGKVKYRDKKTYTGNLNYPSIYAQENGSGIDTETVKTDGIGVSDKYYTMPTMEGKYSTASKLTVTQTYYRFDNTPSSYFDNKEFYGLIFGIIDEPYWLASRYAHCDSSTAYYFNACFGLRRVEKNNLNGYFMMYSDSDELDERNALRAVVSLEPNVVDINLGKDEYGAWQIRTN